MPPIEKCLEEFCNLNGLTSLIKKPECFKNLISRQVSILSSQIKLFSTQ